MKQVNSNTINSITTVTEKGQVTIPNEIRKALGIRPRDKVRFTLDGGEVRLTPVSVTLESAFGAVPPLSRPEDFNQRAAEAKEERAQKRVGNRRRSK